MASLHGRRQCFGRAVVRWLCLISFNVLTWGGQANSNVTDIDDGLVGEDDGHLVTFTQNTKDGSSEMRVYNAKTMSQEPVAKVQLPLRCPSGFHCYHMSEEQYQAQAGTL